MKTPTKEQLVEAALATLSEHFEGVLILATWTDAKGTSLLSRGSGNYYARLGMAKEYVDKDQAVTSADQIKEALDGEKE